ncbi:MAG: Transcriptional regulator, TetR family protein [Myxococcaceae bacterium]|nr:Transcriptional regulator, TetR family protein [Myxococcaceae bacterium]
MNERSRLRTPEYPLSRQEVNVHSSSTTALPGLPRRETILRAALELFVERGFHGASVPAIAERAGIAAGTMYRYFPSKEALVNELYRALKQSLLAALLADFPFDAPPRGQFRSFFFRLWGFARNAPDAFTFLEHHHHADYLDAESQAMERASLLPFVELLERSRALRITKAIAAPALMAMVWGAFSGLLKAGRLGHLELSDDILASAEGCAWDAIAATPETQSTTTTKPAKATKTTKTIATPRRRK